MISGPSSLPMSSLPILSVGLAAVGATGLAASVGLGPAAGTAACAGVLVAAGATGLEASAGFASGLASGFVAGGCGAQAASKPTPMALRATLRNSRRDEPSFVAIRCTL